MAGEIEQLPLGTLTHLLGHDGGGVASRQTAGGLIAASALPSPDALVAVPGGPLVAGRLHEPGQKRRPGQRTLAIFDAKANLTFAGSTNTTNAAADTADVASADGQFGGSGVRFTPRSSGDLKVTASAALATPVDVSGGGYVRVWFKPIANCNIAGNVNRFAMELHSAGTPAAPTNNYITTHIGGNDIYGLLTSMTGEGRWQAQGCSIGEFGVTTAGSFNGTMIKDGATIPAGVDLTSIKFARMYLQSASGQTAFTMEISHIEWVPNPLPKAHCIIGFDDGYALNYALPAMQRYGFPGVLYPGAVAGIVGTSGKLTPQQLINLQDVQGWQVASQAWIDEDLTRFLALSEDGRTAEFSKLRNWHNSLGLFGGGHGSYYSGVSATEMVPWPSIRRSFRSMRRFDTANGGGHPLGITEMYPWRDPFNIRAVNFASFTGANDWTNRHKLGVDAAIAVKGVHLAMGHNELASAGTVRTNFESFLSYLDANRASIEVVTEDYLYRTYG